MILLDTCALLIISDPRATLPAAAAEAIVTAAPGRRYVSAVSAFEIAVKYSRRQLTLPLSPERWFERSCDQRGLTCLDVTSRLFVAAALLPPIHRDPADRIIVATAQQGGLLIITSDRTIPRYPGVSVVWD
jgi:PIN domain nuclease of toxin-antitoxin system